MKANLFTSILVTMLFASVTFGQDVTTVTATNYDISDNLDLTAVASIFGESKDLADFEYRLNNPKVQISNLDLNRDGQVDYLRVIESIEKNTHLIVLQAVLGRDMFQDVATIEVEKNTRNNTVQVQVVGDVFLYGNNYIYEPVYYVRPVIFNTFWHRGYVAYYSPWYWGYYPTYFSYWAPCPIFRYRNHVHTYVNVYNTYNYVTVRNSTRAVTMHNSVRSNAYERQNPNQAFNRRNEGVRNSYALNQTRSNSVANRSTNNRANASEINSTRANNTVSNTSATRTNAVGTANNNSRSNSVGTSSTSNRSSTIGSSPAPTRSNSVGTSSTSNRSSTIGSSSNTSRSSSVGNSSGATSRGTMGNTSSRSSSTSRTTR